MRYVVAVTLLLAIIVTLGVKCASSQPSGRQAYLPIASAEILISGDGLDQTIQVPNEFADSKNLRIESGIFPKNGQSIANISIYLADDTFFHADNFVDQRRMVLNSYSHDKLIDWFDFWNELIGKLVVRLGENNVLLVKKP